MNQSLTLSSEIRSLSSFRIVPITTMTSFFQSGCASQPYESVRDHARFADTKSLIERIWQGYYPHEDPHCLADAKQHFHARTWEMYLWYVLHTNGFSPTKPSPTGPDYRIQIDKKTVWVEAVAPGRGETEDAVPRLQFLNDMPKPIAQEVPEEAILLRFTHVLNSKRKKYEQFRSKNGAKNADAFIIAINGCLATDYRGDDSSIPDVIKATIGIGPLTVLLDPAGQDAPHSYYQRRGLALKKTGKPVQTDLFLRDEYQVISGVFYSPNDICDVPEQLGAEMYYFHNPRAHNPLPFGLFKFCREYWFDLDRWKLEHKDW